MGYRCFNVEASPPARPGIACTTNILLSSKLVQLLLTPVALNLVMRGCPSGHFFCWLETQGQLHLYIYIYTYKSGKTSEATRGKVSMLYDKSHTHMHKIARSPCVIRLQLLQFRVSPRTVNSSAQFAAAVFYWFCFCCDRCKGKHLLLALPHCHYWPPCCVCCINAMNGLSKNPSCPKFF